MKKAFITGITGQDGSYLTELLLAKGYEVHGLIRRVAMEDPGHRLSRIQHIVDQITLHPGSLDNFSSLFTVINKIEPDECYHLAAQSFVNYSFTDEYSTIDTNINGTLNLISVIRQISPRCRFYFAGSSEMFGCAHNSPQNENTPFEPRSLYGISKVAGFHIVKNYRAAYKMFTCSGILYNHESPRRAFEFVTRKTTQTVARIKLGLADELRLGNLEARRDWGAAPDYVEAMWLMLQQDEADDYVIATGKTHSVKDFVETAFSCVDLDWKKFVVIDKAFYRPSEKHLLVGDYSKARDQLQWSPKIGFVDLIKTMVEADVKRLQNKS